MQEIKHTGSGLLGVVAQDDGNDYAWIQFDGRQGKAYVHCSEYRPTGVNRSVSTKKATASA